MANAQFGAPISLEGIQGLQGLQGQRGFSTLAGNGAPAPDLGEVGDIYVDLDAGLLYAPKTASGWPSATRSLIGPQGVLGDVGPRGASLLSDYGAPEDSVGVDGDTYFNTQNASIYGPKAGGHWPSSFTSLIGPSGSQGAVGTMILAANGGPNDAQGVEGDFFVDTLDGRLYGPKADGVWGNGISLIGPMGSTGAIGPRGLAGMDGATILQGQGAPDSQGKPGDFYFDSAASMFYGPRTSSVLTPWPPQGFSVRGDVGPVGPQGPGGMMGADGKTLRSGMGDPADSFGDDGDFYFNAATGYLVGPKASGKWPLPGFLLKGPSGDRGPTGQTGSQGIQGPGILAGAGAPASATGTQGSFYIDGQNYVLYGPKDESAQNPWTMFRNIVGPQGPQGAASTVPGPQGGTGPRGFSVQNGQGAPPNTLGNDGDLYVDLTGPNLYAAKQNGAWPTTFQSLAGAQGPVGPTSTTPGPSGPKGYSLLTGGGPPSASYGNDGDAYIDINAGNLYGAKVNGVWPTQYQSLIGAQGTPGAVGAAGSNGKDGTVLRYGGGAPTSSTVANNGDFYIDQTASRLYGPKASGAFPNSSVSLVGPTGANGALIITGNGPPSAGIGTLGDIYIDLTAGNLYGSKTSSGWPTAFTSLVGAMGGQGVAGTSIQTGQGTPANTVGNVGDIYVDLQGGFLFGPKASSGWPSTYKSLVGPQGAAGQMGSAGAAGFSVQSGSGAPANTLGNVGDLYLDTASGNLYGAKTSSGWPNTFKSLIGPQGAQGSTGAAGSNATLPNDITGNSLVLAPVSGDTSPVQLKVSNASGQVFLADASGNVTVAGSLTAAGPSSLGATSASTLTASGAASVNSLTVMNGMTVGASASIVGAISATRFAATSAGNASAPIVGFSKDFLGSGNVTSTGFYTEGNFGQLYEVVESFVARSLTYVGTNPRDNGAGFLTHNAITNVSGAGNVAHRWYVSTSTLAMSISGSGNVYMAAGLGVTGGIALASGAISFPDGSTLSTATVANQAAYKATSPGTAAAPAHAYTGAANGAGLYFDGNANNLFSVNGFKSLYSTAAAGAAAGANGWAISSTLGAGNALLAFFGGGNTTTPVVSVDGAGVINGSSIVTPTATHSGAVSTGALTATGLVTVPNITLSANGKVTFGDGTVMTTAATSSGGSGSAGAAGTQMRYGTGAPTTTNPSVQNDGDSYIDQQQSMLYGPRANGAWPNTPVSLIGPSGPQGPTGPANATSRSLLYSGSVYAASATANTVYPMQEVVQSGTTVGQFPCLIKMLRSGSLTGYSFNQNGSASGNFTLAVTKNTAAFASFPNIGSGQNTFAATVAAGTYAFAAGDVLALSVSTSGTGAMYAMSYLELTTN